MPIVFAGLPNSNVCELDVERSKTTGPEVIELENATCKSNKTVVYKSSGLTESREGGWERVTSRKRRQRKCKVSGLKERS